MYYVGIEKTPFSKHSDAVLAANDRLKKYRVGDEVPVYTNPKTNTPYFSI